MDQPNQRFAPSGAIWVCGACGKTAQDRYGIHGEHDHGWDESCTLNSILCRNDDTLKRGPDGTGRVTAAEAFEAAA